MIRFLQSGWTTAAVGGAMYMLVTYMSWFDSDLFAQLKRSVQFASVRAGQHSIVNDGPSWRFSNPEFDQWIAEMKKEKEALDLREQQLNDLDVRLQSERQEITGYTQTVHQLQAEFDKNVIRIKEQEVDNLRRQAKVLAGMNAESAADLISEMPEGEAVRILFTMRPDDASAILEAMSKESRSDTKRAAILTERLRRALPPDPKAKPKTP
jgi:flagellar motility protein MotE (MotC chaperone)